MKHWGELTDLETAIIRVGELKIFLNFLSLAQKIMWTLKYCNLQSTQWKV
jgi:hypothetical protein